MCMAVAVAWLIERTFVLVRAPRRYQGQLQLSLYFLPCDFL